MSAPDSAPLTMAERLQRAQDLADRMDLLSTEAQRDFPRCRANVWLALAAEAAAKAARRLEQIEHEARP